MKKLPIILLTIGLIASIGFLIKLNSNIEEAENTISNIHNENSRLENKIRDLEQEKEELESEKSELEIQLASVQHFDDSGYVGSGYSSDYGSISFTGNVIESRINGEFKGWEGETIYKLMDGSIWQQASYEYRYHYAYSPAVIIYKKSGSYYMKVEGIDDEIRVQRIR